MNTTDLLNLRKLSVSEFVFRGDHLAEIFEVEDSLRLLPADEPLLPFDRSNITAVRLTADERGFKWTYERAPT